jgi:hypothetical protein
MVSLYKQISISEQNLSHPFRYKIINLLSNKNNKNKNKKEKNKRFGLVWQIKRDG